MGCTRGPVRWPAPPDRATPRRPSLNRRAQTGTLRAMQASPVSIQLRPFDGLDSFVFARLLAVSDGWTEARSMFMESSADWPQLLAALSGAGFTVNTNVDDTSCLVTRATGAGDTAVKVDNYGDGYGVTVAGQTAKAAQSAMEAVRALLPGRVYATANEIDVSFWTYDPMFGGNRYYRGLERHAWTEVGTNYPSAVRSKLDPIIGMQTAPTNGRLFVFHGPPGSGKSRLIQAIATEWVDWCDVHYVIDADMFFGDASYMTKVMLGNQDSDRWRLVVAEDSDEFIDAHSKHRTGQGSARLLNIADGLVGQGLKVVVLVTTNVHAARFSKAVVRPGRCAALVEFPAFPATEAAEWCATMGVDAPEFTEPQTLAQLYDLTRVPVVGDPPRT